MSFSTNWTEVHRLLTDDYSDVVSLELIAAISLLLLLCLSTVFCSSFYSSVDLKILFSYVERNNRLQTSTLKDEQKRPFLFSRRLRDEELPFCEDDQRRGKRSLPNHGNVPSKYKLVPQRSAGNLYANLETVNSNRRGPTNTISHQRAGETSGFSHPTIAMVVRNSDGTVEVERGRQNGFYASTTPTELVGKRKFHGHRGRNRFFFCGRLMMSKSNGAFFVTLTLIVSTMICFYVFDAAYVAENISLALPIVVSVLFLFVLANLFKTSFSDPGILPRAANKEVLEHERLYRIETGNPSATNPRSKSVPVLQQCLVVKFCYTCRLFRPPRSSHCSVCDNCVLRFDHHCPWVGNCVGLRNYRHFYMFILLLTILDLFVGGCAVAHLVMLSMSQRTFINAIQLTPGSLFVAIMCLLSVWSVLGLSGFHTYLLASNQTTNEEVKDTFADMWPSNCGSLYSTGNFFTNCFTTLCAPEVPSLLDRRGRIAPDTVITVQPEAIVRSRKTATQWQDGQPVNLVENLSASGSSASIHSYSSCSVQRVADDPQELESSDESIRHK